MSTPILSELQRQIKIRAHKDAIKELESNQPSNMLSSSKRINEKFQARKKKNQEIADALAAEEIQRLVSAKVAAATPPVAAKATPAPAAPKADPAPVATTITAAQFIAQASHNGPRMARSEANKLTESQKKRLADANGRIVPDSKAAKPAKPSFSHLTGLARAQAVAKWEAAEKAKNASR